MIIDWFLPKKQHLSQTDQFKSRVLISIALTVSFTAFILLLFISNLPVPPDNLPRLKEILFVMSACTILFKFIPSPHVVGNMVIGFLVLIYTNHIYENGFLFFPEAACMCLMILMAFLILKPKYAFFWSSVVLCSCVFFYFFANADQNDLLLREMTEDSNNKFFFIRNLLTVLCILILINISYYHYSIIDKKFEESSNVLKEINDRLILERNAILKESESFKNEKSVLTKMNMILQQKKDTLEESKENLKASNLELEQYAHAASHDLKQPIRTINSFAQLLDRHLKTNGIDDPVSAEYLDFILKSSKNMGDLVEDLLEFGKISSAKNEQFKLVELIDIVELVKNEFLKEMRDEKIILTVAHLPELNLIPVKMKQLLRNIFGNAIKFRKENQPLLINISATEKESCWEIRISDNGIGIEEQYIEKIFEPFRRLHSKEQFEGSGLGLATCQKIVNLHHGKIWAESKKGIGTTIIFTLSKDLKNEGTQNEVGEEIVQTV